MIGWILVARITACDVSEAANGTIHYVLFWIEGDPNDLCTEVRFHFGRKIACSSIDSQSDDIPFSFFIRNEMVYIPSITVDA